MNWRMVIEADGNVGRDVAMAEDADRMAVTLYRETVAAGHNSVVLSLDWSDESGLHQMHVTRDGVVRNELANVDPEKSEAHEPVDDIDPKKPDDLGPGDDDEPEKRKGRK